MAGRRGGPTSEGVFAWWARRHIQRCVDCRAEAVEWERIVSQLRQVDRPAAPPGLLDRVMAGIALERAASAQSGPIVEREASAKRLWSPDGPWVREALAGLAFYLATSMGALGGATLILPQSFGLVERVVALAQVAAASWRSVVLDAAAVFERTAYAFPEGLQPLAIALWWSVVGMLVTAGILQVSQRRRSFA